LWLPAVSKIQRMGTYHFQHLIGTTPLHTTRPEPYRTHQHLARAEPITPARKTIAQRARTQRRYPNIIPNRYYRYFQRYFDPDAAFHHLCQHTLHAVLADQPYSIALDGATVPRTGTSDARYANPAARRSEIHGWIASLQRVRAWLNAAGRAEQRLLCVGDGRGDTKALGTLELPNTVCLVRTRQDSRRCALPQDAPSGRGRRRVYGDQMWTPQDKWQQRTGWRRVPLVVRGRAVRLLVQVAGPCRRVGRAGVFLDCCARTSQAHQAGQVARADGVLGSRGFGGQGGLAVACAVGAVVVEVVAALGGGVSVAEERVWVGGEAVLGF
jgi:hypothetical protein